jgi:hypothetical protein
VYKNQHCALIFVNILITNAAATCFGTYVPSSGSIFVLVSTWKLRQLCTAIHSCLRFHVLTRTKTLPEDGTKVPNHIGAALVINILTKLSAQCWFPMHSLYDVNPSIVSQSVNNQVNFIRHLTSLILYDCFNWNMKIFQIVRVSEYNSYIYINYYIRNLVF